jgi:hypothetical protein
MNQTSAHCQYIDPEGSSCPNMVTETNFCFWHDKQLDKQGEQLRPQLEHYVQHGGFTRGIILKGAELAGIDLVNHHQQHGYDFSYADFYRANLQGAHMFNINLSHASIMKANVTDAKLNHANLTDCNLLGVKWQQAKIESIVLGKRLQQERKAKQALKSGQKTKAHDYFEQAEEIYRDIRKHAETEGIFALSGKLIQHELTMRRYQLPKYSGRRLFSKVIDLFCGYGENPLRIVGISILMITLCAVLYSITGLNYHDTMYVMSSSKSAAENLSIFMSCLYYSVVTFTTLGYGDFTPIGISRAIAAIEAFTGSFTIALFVVVFVKKMTR